MGRDKGKHEIETRMMASNRNSFLPGASVNKKTKIQVSLHATNLRNVAGMFKGVSDPFAILTILASDESSEAKILGRTEVIKNCLNPIWTTHFVVDFEFGQEMKMNVSVWDEVRKSKDKNMGSAVFEVGSVLGSKGNVKAKRLKKGGVIYVTVRTAENSLNLGKLTLQLKGIKLKNMDSGFRGKSDPFFELSRQKKGTMGERLWRTEFRSNHVKNDLNPIWDPMTIDLFKLCNGVSDKPIRVTVYDFEKKGDHKVIGSFETSLDQILTAAEQKSDFILMQNDEEDVGSIAVTGAKVIHSENTASHLLNTVSQSSLLPPIPSPAPLSIKTPTFVDYISGGCELDLSIAIDFTSSNGNPADPNSLHYIHPNNLNDYEKAIHSVASIISKYDHNQKFTVWGFGVNQQQFGGIATNNCFLLGEEDHDGIGGVLKAYRKFLAMRINMSEETSFHEVIDAAARKATQTQEKATENGKQAYKILLILTNGEVNDLSETRNSIAMASTSPLSIVIVGMGNKRFQGMQYLDDFSGEQDFKIRDITQFVEFNAHRHNKNSLTREVLEEIPDQLVSYFYEQNIMPLAAVHRTNGHSPSIFIEDHDENTDIDLDLNFNPGGDIFISGTNGIYDTDNNFDTKISYFSLSVIPPPLSCPAVSEQHQNQTITAPYVPDSCSSRSIHQPSQPYVPIDTPKPYQPTRLSLFKIKVPDGIMAGMQINAKHPLTGQIFMITVPDGFPPGSIIEVQCK